MMQYEGRQEKGREGQINTPAAAACLSPEPTFPLFSRFSVRFEAWPLEP
jgi:hypothetical protein